MLRLFKKFKALDWFLVVLLIAASVGQAYFDVYMPQQTARLFERMLGGYGQSYLWQAGGRMLAFGGGSFGMNIIGSIIAAFLAANIGKVIRRDLFSKVQRFGFEEMNRFSTASLITRATNDITQAQMVMVFMLRIAISSPITAVWAIIRISNASLELTLLAGATIVATTLLMLILTIFVVPKFKLIQKYTDKLNGVARQNLTGLRVVKAYNAEDYEEEKFNKVNHNLNKTNVFANSVMGLMTPILMFVMNGINLGIFWLGAHLMNQGSLNFPHLMEFSGLIMQVLMAFLMVGMLLTIVPRAQVSAKRVIEVLETEPRVVDPEEPKDFNMGLTGEIEFDNVGFSYPGAEGKVLDGITFTAKKGETVAFIGSTGSGKSTLINLVPRFYDATEGAIRVDGRDVREVTQKSLRSKIGYVPQKASLFSGTIASNIGYGQKKTPFAELALKDSDKTGLVLAKPEGSDNYIVTTRATIHEQDKKRAAIAAHVAMADEFIEEKEGKYDAPVAQGGKNFSGGQKQRMSIARAIAAQPDILIFDDSFSALDYKTDREVRARLRTHTQDSTKLIVAQRIGTIMDADKIIVLEKGRMVGMGTHRELLDTCEVYKEIALSQLSEEELA